MKAQPVPAGTGLTIIEAERGIRDALTEVRRALLEEAGQARAELRLESFPESIDVDGDEEKASLFVYGLLNVCLLAWHEAAARGLDIAGDVTMIWEWGSDNDDIFLGWVQTLVMASDRDIDFIDRIGHRTLWCNVLTAWEIALLGCESLIRETSEGYPRATEVDGLLNRLWGQWKTRLSLWHTETNFPGPVQSNM